MDPKVNPSAKKFVLMANYFCINRFKNGKLLLFAGRWIAHVLAAGSVETFVGEKWPAIVDTWSFPDDVANLYEFHVPKNIVSA